MTKHLLTALLIAGLSATAKAEPTVYYCTTTHLVSVSPDGVKKYSQEPFKLFIDAENKAIEIRSDAIGFALSHNPPESTVNTKGTHYFDAHGHGVVTDFVNGDLDVAILKGYQKILYKASCDKF